MYLTVLAGFGVIIAQLYQVQDNILDAKPENQSPTVISTPTPSVEVDTSATESILREIASDVDDIESRVRIWGVKIDQ